MAKLYEVRDRKPVNLFCTNRVEYFDLGPAVEVSSRILLSEPGWDLYALDFENSLASFVKLNAGPEPYSAPFLYAELFERAVRLVLLPFDEFLVLAQDVGEPKHLVHLLSMGRCGSTIAHHLFNSVDGVLCLSEPDTYLGLAMARRELSDVKGIALLKACDRFHFLAGTHHGDHTLVIKHHSQSLFQAERLVAASPSAKFIFMYRDAESWGDSVFRMAQSFGHPPIQNRKERELLWYILSAGADPETMGDIIDIADDSAQSDRWIAVLWAIHAIEYSKLFAGGLKMHAINFADLKTSRAQTVRRLFEFCSLPTNELERALKVFDRDSQAGTNLARDRKTIGFSSVNYANFRDTLSKFESVNAPGVILPSL